MPSIYKRKRARVGVRATREWIWHPKVNLSMEKNQLCSTGRKTAKHTQGIYIANAYRSTPELPQSSPPKTRHNPWDSEGGYEAMAMTMASVL